MRRIIVCGYMIRHPVTGLLLAYFHYVLGLHRLGYEIVYLEESGWPGSCYDPVSHDYGDDPSAGLRTVQALLKTYGMNVTVLYVNRDTGTVYGGDWEEVKLILKTADLLVNLGGVCWLPEFCLCKRRVLIDMDPFFTQIRRFAAEGRNDYHLYFSYGVNIGRSSCTIPADGIKWLPIVPPVVPELWQSSVATPEQQGKIQKADAAFTTVANWSAYGGVNYQGEHYGQKDEEFMRLLELPSRCSQKLELAISGGNEEIKQRLRIAGWLVRDGAQVSANISEYQAYLTQSRGEFSAAKNAYVKTRSGWFSDRSVCYLAAGRPVVLQDTGFSKWLTTGQGVLAFSSLEEAVDCIEQVNRNYLEHCTAAKTIAERVFSYKVVLPRLMELGLEK